MDLRPFVMLAILGDVRKGVHQTPPGDPQEQPAPRVLAEERSCEKAAAAGSGEAKGQVSVCERQPCRVAAQARAAASMMPTILRKAGGMGGMSFHVKVERGKNTFKRPIQLFRVIPTEGVRDKRFLILEYWKSFVSYTYF